jgi:hypothetical protein
MENFEKLGVFYLGKSYDIKEKKISDSLTLYDSKDLTTHAVCIGMTGSGKTGLCVGLLEEAAIDGIPAIIVDPKGDMTNLLLTSPNLSPSDFLPWINKNEAEKKGLTPEAYAEEQATLWSEGLENWGQSKERIQRLRGAADFSIYTPGSTAGLPVSILNSFAAPPLEVIQDTDTFAERISTTITSLLGLLGIDADPIQSREYILLSSILNHLWGKSQDIDLSRLIQSIQSPPFSKIGVFDLEAFFPTQERIKLAMTVNNLLASPSFQSWLQGEPLDIDTILYSREGRPRHAIFYISHLSDAERMFFVSLLLNQLIGWMRTQPGTGSLRALLYIDELYGYMPPVADPATKKPLLILLKQARAFGLGIVLATQNPVDLDYKGLANIGTWFIGRLQTEQDLNRILDGLSGASGAQQKGFDRKSLEKIITQLGKRVFVLHNVHEDTPEVFHTRWVMSYLAGPLTRAQIKELKQPREKFHLVAESPVTSAQGAEPAGYSQPPTIDPNIYQHFIPIRQLKPEGAKIVYQPYLWGSAKVRFVDSQRGIENENDFKMITPITTSAFTVQWENAIEVDLLESELSKKGQNNAQYDILPLPAKKLGSYREWEKELIEYLYRTRKLELLYSPNLKEISRPGEGERDFRIRLSQIAREQRDSWTEKLREKYARKTASLQEKIRRGQERIAREQEQVKQQKLQTAISIGATILGAFLGRKAVSQTSVSKAGTAMRSASRTMKEAGDVERAKQNLNYLQQQLDQLQIDFQNEVNTYSEKIDALTEEFEVVSIRPKKTDISAQLCCLVWSPQWVYEDDRMEPAWK